MGLELNTIFTLMKRSYIYLVLYFTLLVIHSCKPDAVEFIMTVNGPIDPSYMGTTLVHEHLLVDFIGADSTGYHRWDKDEVVEIVTPYLSEIQNLKVNTLIECTPAYVGRDPLLLQKLSEKTGLHLITNTGYYGAGNNRFLPQAFYEMSAKELAALWIEEYENGIEGSGVRPGFIKIAVKDSDTLSKEHVKIITAAALTHMQTGLVIASHTGPDKPAFEQIKVLQSYGIDPSTFIWVHAQRGTLKGNFRAARAGSWISLDNVNLQRESGSNFSMEWYADRIVALKEANLLHRVLISHDAGWYSPGEESGGNFRGFTAIFTNLIPILEEHGLSPEELNQLLVINPREAFTIRVPA